MAGLCTLVLTGAPLTSRAPDLARALVGAGWQVQLIATSAAGAWIDAAALRAVAGHAPWTDYRRPCEPKRGPAPDVLLVAPATFNTVNKLAAGIADTYAHSVLAEALGSGLPVVVVPMVNDRLWGHYAFTENLGRLAKAGVRFLDIQTGASMPTAVGSGTGPDVVSAFDPEWVLLTLAEVAQKS